MAPIASSLSVINPFASPPAQPIGSARRSELQEHADRRFTHIVSVGRQIHCLEVIRQDGRYRACLYVCVDRLLLRAGASTGDVSPRPAHPTDKVVGRMVATSHGSGYETLAEVLRSLRKDVEINGMAQALAHAAAGRMSVSGLDQLARPRSP